MERHYKCIVFITFCIFGFLSAIPRPYVPSTVPMPIPNYGSHKNFNLLPPKNECGINQHLLVDKVFGGAFTILGEFPWIVRLKYDITETVANRFTSVIGDNTVIKCAGALINQRYVVTAAHCIVEQGKVVQVILGEHDERTNPDVEIIDRENNRTADPIINMDIEEIITHELYNKMIKHNDIALIRLKNNVKYTQYVAPICLPLNGESAPRGHNLTLAGWGKTENNISSPIKLKAVVPVVSQHQCSPIYASANRRIIHTQICAGGKEGVDSCNGDSGGPLINPYNKLEEQFYLEGIVSFGVKNCGKKHVPGVYTRVSSFIDWILDHMKPF